MQRSISSFIFPVFCAASLALSVFFAPPLLAQENEISQLRQKVVELEQRVKELEALLQECTEARRKQGASGRGWQNKKNWRILQIGMSESQVRNTLGEPVKVIKGVQTLWYYPNFYGGYVSFDEEGKLIGWNEP